MHLEGSHSFSASPDRIWELLNDPDVLVRTTPGLKSLEPDGEDLYRAEFQIKLGPVNGGFSGSLAVRDRQPPRSYRLEIDVGGRIGSAKAEGTFDIRGQNGGAVVTFAGDARLKGVLARMGGRVLSGVARLFTKQFFEALEKEV
jgi:carbon monoxide dehydrogenase subunit G